MSVDIAPSWPVQGGAFVALRGYAAAVRASCQGCGATMAKIVPDTCPVCGRTPPVVIAPDTRPEWQQERSRRTQRHLYIVVALFSVVGLFVAFFWIQFLNS